jgi:hypothetical protein
MGCSLSTQQGSEGPRDALAPAKFRKPRPGEAARAARKTVFDLEAENCALRKQTRILQHNLVRDEYRRSVYEVYEVRYRSHNVCYIAAVQ